MSNYTIESSKGMVIIRRHTQTITTSSPIAKNDVKAVTYTSLNPDVAKIEGYTICGFRAFGNSTNVNAHPTYMVPRNSEANITQLHNKNTTTDSPSSSNGTFTIDIVYIRNDMFTEVT